MKPDDRVGSLLANRFRLERVLGRGGMGAVYAASHGELGHRVAIKVLGREARRIPEAAARFAREGQLSARLSSPHVVRVHDVGRSDEGDPFIVMELLVGRDLANVIADPAPLEIARAVRLVLEGAAGTAVAHAAGLVHRDLKPANLFLAEQSDGTEIVKVLDFGLSKVVGPVDQSLTQSASAFGTPQYMSPEQVMSAKHVDARCDQHALGMILFELLAKRPPFVAPTAAALTVVIVTEAAPRIRSLRPEVPRALDEAVARALAKKPGDRFADLGAFARALAPFGGEGASRLAEGIARTLAGATAVGVEADPRAAVSDEVVTMPDATTMPGVSSRKPSPRAAAPVWVAIAALLAAALAVAAVALSRRGPLAPHPSAPAETAESNGGAIEALPAATATGAATGSAEVAPAAAPARSSAPASSASSPVASARGPAARPPPSRPHPRPTAHPARDASDPTEVFGRAP